MTATLTREKKVVPVARKDDVTIEILSVTPELAALWLQVNNAGRKLRTVQVAKYADDMKHGRWVLTGDAIKFDVDGALRDGQHRLAAICAADVAVTLPVVRGLPTSAQLFMDVGAKRTVADQLAVSGHTNPGVLAAGARLLLAWTTGQLSDRIDKISDAAIREFVDQHPDVKDAAEFAVTIRCSIPQSSICAVVWRLCDAGHSESDVYGFFRALADFRSEGPGDPRYALLHRIATARARRERIKQTQMVSMLIRTFNAAYTDKEIFKMFVVSKSGGFIDIPDIVSPKSVTAS